MTFVSDLEPTALWRHFDTILAIPRASKAEDRMRAHVEGVAEGLGLAHCADGAGNLVVRKPATAGHDRAAVTILQSHLDMVQEKNSDVDFDFAVDAIVPQIDGDYLTATGTTLGSDNGIGVAMMLALAMAAPLDYEIRLRTKPVEVDFVNPTHGWQFLELVLVFPLPVEIGVGSDVEGAITCHDAVVRAQVRQLHVDVPAAEGARVRVEEHPHTVPGTDFVDVEHLCASPHMIDRGTDCLCDEVEVRPLAAGSFMKEGDDGHRNRVADVVANVSDEDLVAWNPHFLRAGVCQKRIALKRCTCSVRAVSTGSRSMLEAP